MELALVILSAGVVVAVAVVLMVSGSSRSRRRVERERRITVELEELERTAGAALVRTDERIRLADDELGFAIAEFGDEAGAEFGAAVQRARQRLSEAFHLNQLLSDHVPDTDAQRREWTERIIALCQSAETSIEEQRSAFAARRAAARRTPSNIQKARADIGRARETVPLATATLSRLTQRYSDAALVPISANPAQAEQLLDFAERSTEVAESRLAASRDEEADKAAHAAAESVRRAGDLLAAVSGFEVEALQAESTLAAMVAESRAELAEARLIPERERNGRIDAAITALENELAALPEPGERLDPVGSLSAVRRANSALDEAVAERAQRAEQKERLRAQLVTAIDDAERQIASAREMITDYRAPIGPDARTRLAEAERELAAMTDEQEPGPAITRARRAASLAAEAASYARADLEGAQAYGGWDSRRTGYGSTGSGVVGGVLGGLVLGGLLDELGDMGDFFE